jgi:hypothetical protein
MRSKDYCQKVLYKTYSPRERARIWSILKNPRAGHWQRTFLVGRLWSHGYSEAEIKWIAHNCKEWRNYVFDITEEQVENILKRAIRNKLRKEDGR